jgi:patatin-like phospholipase/acyl hydrolase
VSQKDRIFSNLLRWRTLRHPFRAKYRPARLETALKEVFGERLLGESRVPLVVPSYNLGDNAVYLFKTPHHPRLRRDHRVPMWAVAMATAAAPTFFPAARLPDTRVRLIDGGVWANNPSVVGVVEAHSMFGAALDGVRVLSIGTTENTATRPSRLDNAGLIRWLRGPSVVEVLMRAQSAGAVGQVEHLVGRDNAHRLDAPAPADLAALDRCDADDLIGKASHHSRLFSPTFAQAFQPHRPASYIPLYGPKAEGVPT